MSRLEHDFLGELTIDDSVYYGVQTLRAMNNFHISGTPLSQFPEMIWALACVKKACALANMELQVLPRDIGIAICAACDRILAGNMLDQFPVDCIQGGAGTSTNMNANEVIANLALEIMGHPKGAYTYCHPNNHVNCSQSTNDVYPTALRLALFRLLDYLVEHMIPLQKGFAAKSVEFSHIVKMGRTQLQDAVPMTLGQEFGSYATTIGEDIQRIHEAQKLLLEVNLGATAIGTGINSPQGYAQLVVARLAEISDIPVRLSTNLVEATWDTGAYVQTSGVLKRTAVKISKICNDLRLLSSGPRTGFHEINLPRMQPGSSIMPGKVNPVIPEVTNQAAFLAIGLDTTVMLASSAGQLELNVMEPVITFALYMQMKVMTNACNHLREKCIDGIVVNAEHCKDLVMGSLGIITILKPHFGYKPCANIAREGFLTGKSLHQLVVEEKQMLTQEQWDKVFTYENLINPKFEK